MEDLFDYQSSQDSISDDEHESFFSNEKETVNLNDESFIKYSTPS